MLDGSVDHTTNSGSTSAERKRGLGGRTPTTCPPSATGRSPPHKELPPWPREATTGTVVYLRGRPQPRLVGGSQALPGGAFPFSVVENLFGAMRTVSSQEEEKEQQEGTG